LDHWHSTLEPIPPTTPVIIFVSFFLGRRQVPVNRTDCGFDCDVRIRLSGPVALYAEAAILICYIGYFIYTKSSSSVGL
jgi:hypothetical protein